MSLRSRLLAGFMLVAIVLVAADAVVALRVHRSLIRSIDQRLAVARRPPRTQVAAPGGSFGDVPSGASTDIVRPFPSLTAVTGRACAADL